jgi:hypothetical protein
MAIRLTRIDDLALVTVDRPEVLNALNAELLRNLGAAFYGRQEQRPSTARQEMACRQPEPPGSGPHAGETAAVHAGGEGLR